MGTYSVDVTFTETLQSPDFTGMSFSGTSTYTGANSQVSSKTYRFRTADSTATDTAKPFSFTYVP
ncbi:MAG: hypothetical protein QMC36_08815 [Patescibacteria group bacterium]